MITKAAKSNDSIKQMIMAMNKTIILLFVALLTSAYVFPQKKYKMVVETKDGTTHEFITNNIRKTTFVEIEDPIDPEPNNPSLEGTWRGQLFISMNYNGRVYDSTYSEITFDKNPFEFTSGQGNWVDYYSNNPCDYMANTFHWSVSNGVIKISFTDESAYFEIRDYELRNDHFYGTLFYNGYTVDFDLVRIIRPEKQWPNNQWPEEPQVKADKTVLVYIAAENNLGYMGGMGFSYRLANDDISEMKQGAKSIGNNHLVLYVDKCNDGDPLYNDPKPYILHFYQGELRDSIPMEESLTADPSVFENVIRRSFTTFPAQSYGLVLWGYSSGWIINNDSVPYYSARRKAYGGDTGDNSYGGSGRYWMNIPSMASALSKLPHLEFIFADCCNMMCAECAYELKDVTDYFISSPAEIPVDGAPYDLIIPAMMEKGTFYQSICDKYATRYDNRVPLAVIKSSEMENLAKATKMVLKSMKEKYGESFQYPDLSGLIHYYSFSNMQMYNDANDFMLKYAETTEYNSWKQALENAVIYKKIATNWDTALRWNYYSDFVITDENFSGLSMFIPQIQFLSTYNAAIRQMSWYYATGYSDIGW